MGVGHAVLNPQLVHRQTVEDAADIRVIVDADHHLAAAAPHDRSHRLVLVQLERDAVAFYLPIGRIKVKERVGPVVALDALLPVQVLDRGAG